MYTNPFAKAVFIGSEHNSHIQNTYSLYPFKHRGLPRAMVRQSIEEFTKTGDFHVWTLMLSQTMFSYFSYDHGGFYSGRWPVYRYDDDDDYDDLSIARSVTWDFVSSGPLIYNREAKVSNMEIPI